MARMLQYVNNSECVQLDIDEVEECSLGPEYADVDVKQILRKRNVQKEAPKKYQEKVFEEFKELEEQRAKEALVLVQRKRMLVKWEGERERANILQRLGGSRAIRHWSGARDSMSVESRSSSMAESSKKKLKDMDETTSGASWIAVTKGKEKEVWRLELRVKRNSLKPQLHGAG